MFASTPCLEPFNNLSDYILTFLGVKSVGCESNAFLITSKYSDSLPWGIKNPHLTTTYQEGAHQQSFKFLRIRKNRRWRGGL